MLLISLLVWSNDKYDKNIWSWRSIDLHAAMFTNKIDLFPGTCNLELPSFFILKPNIKVTNIQTIGVRSEMTDFLNFCSEYLVENEITVIKDNCLLCHNKTVDNGIYLKFWLLQIVCSVLVCVSGNKWDHSPDDGNERNV